MLAAKIVEPSDVLGDRELGLEGSCELVAIEQGDALRRQGRTVTIIEPSACELERAPAWFPVLLSLLGRRVLQPELERGDLRIAWAFNPELSLASHHAGR